MFLPRILQDSKTTSVTEDRSEPTGCKGNVVSYISSTAVFVWKEGENWIHWIRSPSSLILGVHCHCSFVILNNPWFLQSQAIWRLLMETCQDPHQETGERGEGGQNMWQNLAPPSLWARVTCPTCQCCNSSQYFYTNARKTQTRSSYECMSERNGILCFVFMGHDMRRGLTF